MSDQWKEKGDCKNCVKRGRCTHSCAAHKRRMGEDDKPRMKHREVYA
jgi:hypothetical protein